MPQLPKTEKELSPHLEKLFQAMVGSLAYLINCTRLDIAFAVNKLAQFASFPGEDHVLRYIKGIVGAIAPGAERNWWGFSTHHGRATSINSTSTFRYTLIYANSAII